ncbi:NYN domain-containing protein, partial [Klebsiella pneumoniae]
LYHAIEETGNKALHWVDLKSLCKRYLPKDASIENVFWFSAKPSHLSRTVNDNYQNYTNALTECGVDVIGGRFKRKNVKCEADNGCGEVFHKHEEKESDVNLAISLVSGACNNEYDIAIIITADSDLCPPIKYVKERFPDKELWLVAPPGRIKRAADLCLMSSKNMEINSNALRASCMRDEFYKGGV